VAPAAVHFGVAGWSYADWKDVVYPRNCKDTLRAVAQRVQLVEVNTTFYHPPLARNCASWVERTADLGTWFTAKLPQEFTHHGSEDAGLVQRTREGFAPLAASGRLLALLAQTNWQVEATDRSIDHFARLQEAFGDLAQLVVEVRHRSWNAAPALERLARHGIAVAVLDYPGSVGGFSVDVTHCNGAHGIAYFRLHGRNRDAWFRHGAGRDEVYHWEYAASEVRQLELRIERLAADARKVLVVANNHFHGNAMKVVEQLMAWYRARTAGAPEGAGPQPA